AGYSGAMDQGIVSKTADGTAKAPAATIVERALRLFRNARFEMLLLALLLLTVAAVKWQDQILERKTVLTAATIAQYARMPHTDSALQGRSLVHEVSPGHWTCELRTGFDYPYCGYEIFFGKDKGTKGLDLTNFRALTVTMTYRGPSKSFRVYLK